MHPLQACIFYFQNILKGEIYPFERVNNQSSSKQAKSLNLYMCFDAIIQRSTILFLSEYSYHLLNACLLLSHFQQTIIAL